MKASMLGERLRRIFGRLWIKIAIPTALVSGLSVFVVIQISLNKSIEQIKSATQQKLLNVVTLAACAISGDEHRLALEDGPDSQRLYAEITDRLRDFRRKLNSTDAFPEHWYTLLQNHGDTSTFGLMTHPQSFTGDTTIFRDARTRSIFEDVWRDHVPRYTDLYMSDNGMWISGLAAITDSNDSTVAVLEIDWNFEDYEQSVAELRREAHGLQLIGVLAAGLLGSLLGLLIARPVRNVSEAVMRIARNRFRGQVTVPAVLQSIPDETTVLIANFNQMAVKLDETLQHLRQANTRLETVDKAKTVFLQFVAHELRTPLTGLDTLRYIAQLQELEPETEEALRDANISAERLRSFALAAERYIRALTHSPEDELHYIDQIVEHLVADLQPLAEQEGLKLEVEFSERNVPVRIAMAALEQILTPLVRNAIKFGRDGKRVRVEFHREGQEAVCSVRDWGAGFQSKFRERIFEPFFVEDIDHHSSSSGVNLAIAKVMAQHYDGSLQAVSKGPGSGAEFILRLPIVIVEDRLVRDLFDGIAADDQSASSTA